MAKKKIIFYSPGGNHYHSRMYLWCIAKENKTNSNNVWLETSWIGTASESGLALFCSQLDAYIQCLRMNASFASRDKWQVYPFSALNRMDMATNMKLNFGKETLGLNLIFGFISSADGTLLSSNRLFRVCSFHLEYQLDDLISQGRDVPLIVSDVFFTQIEEAYQEATNNYFSLLKNTNMLSHNTIYPMAIKQFKRVSFQLSECYQEQKSHFISSCFISLGWKTVEHQGVIL